MPKQNQSRIALLYFGLPRSSAICIPSIEKNVIFPLQEALRNTEFSGFHHLYLQNHVINPRSGENGKLSQDNYQWFENQVGIIEQPPIQLIKEMRAKIIEFGDDFNDHGVSLQNLLLQLHSLHKVTDLFKSERFDAAIFLRPDLEYHTKIPAKAISYAIRNPRACFVPSWQSWGGCNDRFAVCGREAAIVYGCRLDEAIDFCIKKGRALNSEQLLAYTINKHKLKLRTISTQASRVRITGERKVESFGVFNTTHRNAIGKVKMAYLELVSRFL